MTYAPEYYGSSSGSGDATLENQEAIIATLAQIKAKSDLIGTASFNTTLTPMLTGTIPTTLTIGDDYLIANGRQITITFASGITPASCTLKFSKRLECGGTAETFDVTGSASASGGTVTCVFEINAADWDGVTAGSYEWVLEVVDDNGDVMTPIQSRDQRVRYVEFVTVEGRM